MKEYSFLEEGTAFTRFVVSKANKGKDFLGNLFRTANVGLNVGSVAAQRAVPIPLPLQDDRATISLLRSTVGMLKGGSDRLKSSTGFARVLRHPVKSTSRWLDRTVGGTAWTGNDYLNLGHIIQNPFRMEKPMTTVELVKAGKDYATTMAKDAAQKTGNAVKTAINPLYSLNGTISQTQNQLINAQMNLQQIDAIDKAMKMQRIMQKIGTPNFKSNSREASGVG